MKLNARVEGLSGLGKGLSAIASSPALTAALQAAGGEIRSAARRQLSDGLPPQDARRDDLAASLAVSLAPDGRGVTVGTALPHGWHLEFGSLRRSPAPWLAPALEAAKPAILARLREVLSSSAGR
jgi:hypothetical protein